MAFDIIITTLFFIYFINEIFKKIKDSKKEISNKNEQKKILETINKQLLESSLVNKELLKCIKIYSQKYAEEITESQMRIVIDSILSNSQLEVYNYVSKIIKENHVKGNEKEVGMKIKSFINNRYHNDTLILKDFKFKEMSLSEKMKQEWKEYLIENVLGCVLKERGEKSLWGNLQNIFDSFKYDMIENALS